MLMNKTKISFIKTNPLMKKDAHLFNQRAIVADNTSAQLLNYWSEKKQKLKILNTFSRGWNNELLLQFKKNNTQLVLHSARRPDPVYRKFTYYVPAYKIAKQQIVSAVIAAFQTGRLGFIKNQKKSTVAAEAIVTTALWILTQHQQSMAPVTLRLVGQFKPYTKQFLRFLEKKQEKLVYSFIDSTPTFIGQMRYKAAPRKRFRYHLYNFINVVTHEKAYKNF